MARYFMHLRDSSEELIDPEGREFPTLKALHCGVLRAVRDLMADEVLDGQLDLRLRIDAHDAAGTIVYSLPFKNALNIIREGDGTASTVTV